jgi:hypothetical protein
MILRVRKSMRFEALHVANYVILHHEVQKVLS